MKRSHAHSSKHSKAWASNSLGLSRRTVNIYLLLSCLCACGIVHTSLPRLLAQIYGSTAASYDISWFLALIAILLSSITSNSNARTISLFMAGTALSWILFLRFGRVYFQYDTVVLMKIFNTVGAWDGLPTAAQEYANIESYIPVVASSLVKALFELPAMVLLGLIIRLFSHKRSSLMLSSVFLVIGTVTRLLDLQKGAQAGNLYYAAIILTAGSLTTIRNDKVSISQLSLLLVMIWCFCTTTTLSCGVLPGMLRCTRSIGDFSVLSSAESFTGRIAVVQNSKYRLLVADHSLLGGEWVGAGPNQSIFLTFYMQALAIYAVPKQEEAISVLQIGLGIGTATKTILDQPVFSKGHIDVVEIDHLVIENAHDFFDLPRPEQDFRIKTHAVDALDFLEDANVNSYDLISHDIFSGGSLTFDLFTKQFFEKIGRKLKTGGVLTVNYVYAPEIAQDSFEAVINTLRSVFKHVTVFVESGKLNSISNVVLFASNAPINLDIPDSGMEPVTNLGKTAREMKHWESTDLASLPFNASKVLQDEAVDGGLSRKSIRRADHLMAMKHWKFMRELLPEPENQLWFAY